MGSLKRCHCWMTGCLHGCSCVCVFMKEHDKRKIRLHRHTNSTSAGFRTVHTSESNKRHSLRRLSPMHPLPPYFISCTSSLPPNHYHTHSSIAKDALWVSCNVKPAIKSTSTDVWLNYLHSSESCSVSHEAKITKNTQSSCIISGLWGSLRGNMDSKDQILM